ncbi:hypothetical protein M2103_000894 [Ereboglobus sp. PH5-5]|uniref:alpha-2-macroglobulin family protein n=1 Tax=Ereboglobus sp. PH5-5 TaxID=2940529 RepID=UPI0024054745|nr:alpha-2-macroglobulin family protein [Ereboglobus sp. PH5-5]MDF9832680.1 hypothetical protein [Ereboglobus sp. PH5-5]
MKIPSAICWSALFFLGLIFSQTSAASTEKTYAVQVDKAQRLADEKSWALARDAYAEASKFQISAESKRWCEMRQMQAEWRALNSEEKKEQRPAFNRRLDEFLKTYGTYKSGGRRVGGPRDFDAAWTEAMILQIEISRKLEGRLHRLTLAEVQQKNLEITAEEFLELTNRKDPPWETWREILDYHAKRTPNPYNEKWLLDFLEQVDFHWRRRGDGVDKGQRSFGNALMSFVRNGALPAEQKAKYALRAAWLCCEPVDDGWQRREPITSWRDAALVCRGTRYEAAGKAMLFAAQARSWNPRSVVDDLGDDADLWSGGYAAVLPRARELRCEIESAPDDFIRARAIELLDALINNWSKPILSISGDNYVLAGDALKFSANWVLQKSVKAELHQYSMEGYAKKEALKQEVSPKDVLEIMQARLVQSMELFEQTQDGDIEWHSDMFEFAQPPEPGFYMVVVRALGIDGEECVRAWHAIVTGARAVAIVPAAGDAQLYVINRRDGSPLARKTLDWFWLGEIHHSRVSGRMVLDPQKCFSAKTDAEGRVSFPMPRLKKAREMLAMIDGQPFRISVQADYSDSEKRFFAELLFDKPMYWYGDMVRWKLIVRERKEDGRFEPCKQASFAMWSRNETFVKRGPVKFNEFGTVHGEFVLTNRIYAEDSVQAALQIDGEEMEFLNVFRMHSPPHSSMHVEVGLDGARDRVSPGQEIKIRVKARYHQGDAVVGADVKCEMRVESVIHDVDKKKASQKRYEHWLKEQNKSMPAKGVTDANGEAVFTFKIHEALPENSVLLAIGTVEAEKLSPVSVLERFSVSDTGSFADMPGLLQPRLVAPGVESQFNVRVTGLSGKPRAFVGDARIYECRWVEIWLDPEGRQVTGEALAEARRQREQPLRDSMGPGWKKVFADYVTVPFGDSQPVTCGDDGLCVVKFTPPKSGIYEIRLEQNGRVLAPRNSCFRWMETPKDYKGLWGLMKTHERMIFYAADESTASLEADPREALLLGLENYREGKPLKLMLMLPEESRNVFLSLHGATRSEARRVMQKNRVGMVTMETVPTANGLIGAELHGGVYLNVKELVPPGRRGITLEVSAEQDESRPDAVTNIKVVAKDFAGNPVRAELAIAAADNVFIEKAEPPDWTPRSIAFEEISKPAKLRWNYSAVRIWSTAMTVSDRRSGSGLMELLKMKAAGAPIPRRANAGDWREGPQGGGGSRHAGLFAKRRVERMFTPSQRDISVVMPRQHFTRKSFWAPSIVTDANGVGRVSFALPDNSRQWRISAYAVGADGNTFGAAHMVTRPRPSPPLRIQTPRFLVEGDDAVVSGKIENRNASPLTATMQMRGEGAVELADAGMQRTIVVPKQGEAIGTWKAKADALGEATLIFTASGEGMSETARATLPVLESGMRREIAACGRLPPSSKNATVTLALPDSFNRERLAGEIVITRGRAAVVLDALPGLIDSPHGSVEHMVSRFLPAVVVRKALVDRGLDATAVEKRIMAVERRNANARPAHLAKLKSVDDVASKSLAELREAGELYQRGFGWCPKSYTPDIWMTAYVAWGLRLAAEAGVDVFGDWLKSIHKMILKYMHTPRDNEDRLAWALFVMSEVSELDNQDEEILRKAYASAYAAREKLTASGRACLLAASLRWGVDESRAVLLEHLEKSAQHTPRGVHWGSTGGHTRAMEGAVESTALSVLTLRKIDPEHALIEPALEWLVASRHGLGWQNTRASTFAILALIRAAPPEGFGGSLVAGRSMQMELLLNGKKLEGVTIPGDGLLSESVRVALPADQLVDGDNRIELRRRFAAKKDSNPFYATARVSLWTNGGDVGRKTDGLLRVNRYFTTSRRQPDLGGIGNWMMIHLNENSIVRAGEEVSLRVRLSKEYRGVHADETLEYVIITVPKPAGCEPLSAGNSWSGLSEKWDTALVIGTLGNARDTSSSHRLVYREEHDDRSVFYLDRAVGLQELRFMMRAVTPGDFRALPVKVEAMYVPEIRANSDARRVRIDAR